MEEMNHRAIAAESISPVSTAPVLDGDNPAVHVCEHEKKTDLSSKDVGIAGDAEHQEGTVETPHNVEKNMDTDKPAEAIPVADAVTEQSGKVETQNDASTEKSKNNTTDTDEPTKSDPSTGQDKDEKDDESKLPPISLPEPSWGYVNGTSVFCISQQGESHIKMKIPCQDRSAFRWIKDSVLIAAVADGVGSCQLSDYGAETAVESGLDYLEQYFLAEMKHENFVFDNQIRMKEALQGAMQHAYEAVEKRAEELEVLSYSMQSTLTISVYDGETLYFAHAGDDGIVAMNKEGIYAMVTARIKGEEASSVYPLQSRQWFYGKVKDTVAFVMATDGVLDAFVRPSTENNRVYYRFLEPVFYTVQKDTESAEANCRDWDTYLKSPAYRNTVTDDITYVGIVNQEAVKNARRPVFDDAEWERQTEEYRRKRIAALYPSRTDRTLGRKDLDIPRKKDNNGRTSPENRTADGNSTPKVHSKGYDVQNDPGKSHSPRQSTGRTGQDRKILLSSEKENVTKRGKYKTGRKQLIEDVAKGVSFVLETSEEFLNIVGEASMEAVQIIRQNRESREQNGIDRDGKRNPDSNNNA